ncbi:MAG: glycoside hydrolase family 2 protein, partial [Ruminiclostridium sp.]
MFNINVPRPEYPRPDFERNEWLNLNGEWQFDFDDKDIGEENGWYKGRTLSRKIIVPFCFQSEMSGISDRDIHEIMWYKREFVVPESFSTKKIFLNFGAVDYHAKIWINGEFIDSHKGGYVPFKMDITKYLVRGSNSIAVKVVDSYECVQPRGKQYWKQKPDRCWYTATSGIWQTVWLETTGELNIDKIRITPDIDARNALLEVFLNKVPQNAELDVVVSFKGQVKSQIKLKLCDRISRVTIDLKEEDYIDELQYWTPETPNLYDLQLRISVDGKTADQISSYFGMRKISVEGNNIFLNNKPYYLKLILDQGYWTESLLTPPSDESLRYDVEMTRNFGFNGARKHQKIEDPRYYYWADKLGLLVWGEMPSPYDFNSEQTENVTREWIAFINRDYNHPCIMA